MIVTQERYGHDRACSAIADLEARIFGSDAWTPSMVKQELEAPARTYALDVADASEVGGVDGEVRGYAGFWYDGDDAELMTIGVARPYRRQGVAARLLEWLIAEARSQGARRMLLEVRVDNGPAIALYRRFGFTMLGRRRGYYQPDGVDAYTMSCDLQRTRSELNGVDAHDQGGKR
ncbi:ribosomal protein S18-alanine N-acetyltransferase [uncultured Bifidobacterium sp.]|uniref:ribosomal protein S18-alanine N-acetyltransferase n=1 Tax=uncultured Bifidobacterium sp. TaxID=165187 RepID=UPI0026365C3C|nr:ribosomal protein S18-alanine N-acetyltransferase [uncultured Bifidobacterium sp.]